MTVPIRRIWLARALGGDHSRPMLSAYLAGPDVFLPDAAAHARRKLAICRAHGIEGVAPLGADGTGWRDIFEHCLASMERSDLAIVNLTPFRGASADAGTLVELGWFLGRSRPIFAYSNTGKAFAERSASQRIAAPDPLDGLAVEAFGLVDNLMIDGAVERGGGVATVVPADGATVPFDDLSIFERCVAEVAARVAAGGLTRAVGP